MEYLGRPESAPSMAFDPPQYIEMKMCRVHKFFFPYLSNCNFHHEKSIDEIWLWLSDLVFYVGPISSSPSIFPSVTHQKKPSIPVAAQPRNKSKRQNPVALAPKNQGFRDVSSLGKHNYVYLSMNSLLSVSNFAKPITPVSLPSKSLVEYPRPSEGASLIRFHSPPRNKNVKGRYFSSFILRIIL